jgi:mRNA interferase MazF
MVINRFDIFLVSLDPTIGSEIRKTRPALIISPDEMNRHISTVIIAPMTTKGRGYPTRVNCLFRGKKGKSSWIRSERLISQGWYKSWGG